MIYQTKYAIYSDIKTALASGRKVIYRDELTGNNFSVVKIQADFLTVIPNPNCKIVSIAEKEVYQSSVDTFTVNLSNLIPECFGFSAIQ